MASPRRHSDHPAPPLEQLAVDAAELLLEAQLRLRPLLRQALLPRRRRAPALLQVGARVLLRLEAVDDLPGGGGTPL